MLFTWHVPRISVIPDIAGGSFLQVQGCCCQFRDAVVTAGHDGFIHHSPPPLNSFRPPPERLQIFTINLS